MDGTIYSIEGILGPVYYLAVEKFNQQYYLKLRKPTLSQLEHQIGKPVKEILGNLFPGFNNLNYISKFFDIILNTFIEKITDRGGKIYESVPDTLNALKEKGYKLAIASNGNTVYINAILRSFNIEQYFLPLVSVDGNAISTKSEILTYYMHKYSLNCEEVLLVGDRASDMEAAKKANCHFAGCHYGFESNEINTAEAVLKDFSDLLNIL